MGACSILWRRGLSSASAEATADQEAVHSSEPIAKRIAFIGAGKMGEAMIGGLIRQHPSQKVKWFQMNLIASRVSSWSDPK